MTDLEQIIYQLKQLSQPEKARLKQTKFGIQADKMLGIYHSDLAEIARKYKGNNPLALELFESGIYEARILCSKIFKPALLTDALAEKWVATFENWEICDSFCMGVIAKSPLAVPKILEWARRTPEFEKRAAFATLAGYCMADKKAENAVYEQFMPIILAAAVDERLYVKKAVSWALRSIGKRNKDLQQSAIQTAQRIAQLGNKSALWIAKDVLDELGSEKAKLLDYPRNVYRK
jgi:3-methyladenine DNA glycosylase AlkD